MVNIPEYLISLIILASTVCFVLCGVLYSSNKSLFIWTLFGGIVLGLFAVFLYWQNNIWEKQKSISTPAIAPKVSFVMEYPIKLENGKPYRETRNPTIIIKNDGPDSAVSISAKVVIYTYSIKHNEISTLIMQKFRNFDHAISTEELKPFSDMEISTMGINGKDDIAVYHVSASYYRKSDMKPFKLGEYFFAYDKTIYNNIEFSKDDRYQKIIEKIKSYKPSDNKYNEIKITAAAEKTWFVESAPSLLKRKNDDGSVTIVGPPEIQNKSIINKLPHLVVTPICFKDSNQYVRTKIEEDHINVTLKYQVENIGDITAVITENGFDPVIEIKPNQKKFYESTLKFVRGPDNKNPLQEFIKLLDEEEAPIQMTLDLLYHPINNPPKLFKVTVNNKFGRNSVK